MSITPKQIIIPVVSLIAILVLNPFVVIKTSEVGISTKIGKISNTPLTEGIHIKIPLIESIDKVSLREREESFKIEHTQTKDLQPVTINYRIRYSINPEMAINNKQTTNGDLLNSVIIPRAKESVMDFLSKYSAEELNSMRENIGLSVKKSLSEKIKSNAIVLGAVIEGFDFENEKFKEAVQNKVIAKQNAEAAEIKKQQSQAEADQVMILAKAKAESIKIEAAALNNNPKIVELRKIESDIKVAEIRSATDIKIAEIMTSKESKWNGAVSGTTVGAGMFSSVLGMNQVTQLSK